MMGRALTDDGDVADAHFGHGRVDLAPKIAQEDVQ